jgi:hypothetical protein
MVSMNMQQPDKYAQMQSKLEEGLKILTNASDGDSYILGIALIKIHGALEDFVRLELARRAPSLRMEVEDAGKTTWKDLIYYGKKYLRLTERDVQTINEANIQRQRVAHGGNYEKSRDHLERYADFVQRWCNQGKPITKELRSRPVTILRKPYEPPPPLPAPPTLRPVVKQWYRSRIFFFLIFFLLPPLWAILILTDRHQGSLLKLGAGTLFVFELFAAMILADPSPGFLPDSLQFLQEQIGIPFPVFSASPTSDDAPIQSPSPVSDETVPVSATGAACVLVWVEQPSEELAGKNRAMVWEEVVMPQVDGSGMTARQFYDQVLEHNPDLVRDGYEFKQGKTYLLPRCE